MKVLLVDDEEDIRSVGQIALEDFGGWTTLLAASGQEAMQLATASHPDVILLDVMMPVVDGPATLLMLRAQPETSKIPIIFFTAKVQKKEITRYMELGAIGVIAKPFDPTTLAEEIKTILAG